MSFIPQPPQPGGSGLTGFAAPLDESSSPSTILHPLLREKGSEKKKERDGYVTDCTGDFREKVFLWNTLVLQPPANHYMASVNAHFLLDHRAEGMYQILSQNRLTEVRNGGIMRSWCVMIRKLSCVWRPRSNHSSWTASGFKIMVMGYDSLTTSKFLKWGLLPCWRAHPQVDQVMSLYNSPWLIDRLTDSLIDRPRGHLHGFCQEDPRSNFLDLSISACHIFIAYYIYIYKF